MLLKSKPSVDCRSSMGLSHRNVENESFKQGPVVDSLRKEGRLTGLIEGLTV